MQKPPWLTLEPSEQGELAAFAMPLGAEQGLGEQENVYGVREPAAHLRVETLAV